MIEKAKQNFLTGIPNVEFTGRYRKYAVPDHVAHVVISNCVLNLLPSKRKDLHEHTGFETEDISVADVVLTGELPLI